MKCLKLIIPLILFLSCLVNAEPPQEVYEAYKARVTYYHDKLNPADPKVDRAVEGVSVAAHPKFKFGTRIFIPDLKGVIGDGNFVVHDRGSAVTSKKASGGKAFVFDVFVSSHGSVNLYATTKKMYMTVYVVK